MHCLLTGIVLLCVVFVNNEQVILPVFIMLRTMSYVVRKSLKTRKVQRDAFVNILRMLKGGLNVQISKYILKNKV